MEQWSLWKSVGAHSWKTRVPICSRDFHWSSHFRPCFGISLHWWALIWWLWCTCKITSRFILQRLTTFTSNEIVQHSTKTSSELMYGHITLIAHSQYSTTALCWTFLALFMHRSATFSCGFSFFPLSLPFPHSLLEFTYFLFLDSLHRLRFFQRLSHAHWVCDGMGKKVGNQIDKSMHKWSSKSVWLLE